MVGVWLVALVSALEGLNISQPITWYDPVGAVLQDGLVCAEARPGGPHEPTPQPERAYKRETPMMNLDWTHLCTGANGTNMSSCIGGTARSPLNDLRTSVQPHGSSDSQHVSGLPPLWPPTWINTHMQVGDIFTKPLDKTTFLKFRSILLNVRHDLTTPDILSLVGY